MRQFRNIAVGVAIAFVFAWITGCGGCNPAPEPAGMSPTEGPETGGTTVRISGQKFDMKKGVTVTFGGNSAQSVNVPSKTEITAVTPPGTAGQSVAVVVTNKGKPEVPVTLSQQFTYTDATPPTVTSTNPSNGATISEYEDSLNVLNTLTITFSESVSSSSGTISVSVESTPESMSQQSGQISGQVTGSGSVVTFTSDMPLRAGRKYTVTASGFKDTSPAANMMSGTHTFSFMTTTPEPVSRYRVRKGDTLPIIAARPEVYDNASLWPRLVEANQDDWNFDRDRIYEGQMLTVPRGAAWGDKAVASSE